MRLLAPILAAEDPSRTHSWIWPEGYEIYFGGLASIIVFSLLFWKAGPFVKKAMADRTARIQKQLDDASGALELADADAAQIRGAKGDIDGERTRLLADADASAEHVLSDGRSRLLADIADLEAKAETDLALIASRSGDDLRAEIARVSVATMDALVAEHLDAPTHQALIESFIEKVGRASSTGKR